MFDANAIVFDSPAQLFLSLIGLVIGIVAAVWGSYQYGRRGRRGYQYLLAKLPLGVVVLDAQQQQLFSNAPARELLAKLDDGLFEQVRQSAQQRQQVSLTVHGANDTFVQVSAWPLDNRRETLLVLHDLSQQQRREANQRVFVQALSHELQTPLTAIQGHIAHIASHIDGSSSDWRGSLQVVRDEIDRLTWLTPNVLTLLRLDADQPLNRRPHNLGVVAEEAVQHLWEKAAASRITLGVYAETELQRVNIDRSAWKQVFLNLIDNGIKYGVAGGSVKVTLQQTVRAQIISVADDGQGIPAADLPHIFTTFYRVEGQQHIQGSGLGLAIVRQIVERHGGTITCYANTSVGRGVVFQMTLPLSDRYVMQPSQLEDIAVTSSA